MKREKTETFTNERKKGYVLLIVGAVLLAASLVFTLYAHGHSYADSTLTGSQLSEVKELIKAVEAGSPPVTWRR